MSALRRLRPLALVPLVALAACGSAKSDSSSSTTASAAQCDKSKLAVVTKGKLTIATDKPAYPPYFESNDPTNGKGFESAVAYAIARKLGFSPSDVKWTVEPFDSSYAPGPKKFDFDVNQISITPKRAQEVDFSHPYFVASQAVIAPKSSEAKSLKSLDDLKDLTIGVQVGTTSLDAVQQKVQPSKQPRVYNNSNDVVSALKVGQVDAVVVDLPTAFYITAAQVPSAKIIGQFAAPGGDRWGALLAKDSKLTPCVNKAIDSLSSSGELARLNKRWITSQAKAPTLR